MEPRPYRVSTITVTASVNSPLDLPQLFRNLALPDPAGPPASRAADAGAAAIVRAEFFDEDKRPASRGMDVKPKSSRKPRRDRKAPKRFNNQVTLLVRPVQAHTTVAATAAHPAARSATAAHPTVNMKVFRNGNVQMTGVRAPADGVACVEALIAAVREAHSRGHAVAARPDDLRCTSYALRLMNCDFRVPFRINNHALQSLLIGSDYTSIYEPSIYHGVKVLYYWNATTPGVCACERHCSSVRVGAPCKKITIAVFSSGAVIVTGPTDTAMADDAYRFVHGLLLANRRAIEQQPFASQVDKMAAWLGMPPSGGPAAAEGGEAVLPAPYSQRNLNGTAV